MNDLINELVTKKTTNKEIEDWSSVVLKYKIRCKCGHRVFIDKDKDKVLCQVCRNYVFKDKKSEFEYKIKQQLKTNKKNGKPFFGVGYYAKSNCEVCFKMSF